MRRAILVLLVTVLSFGLVSPALAASTPTPVSAGDRAMYDYLAGQSDTFVQMIVTPKGRDWYNLNSKATPRQIGNLPAYLVYSRKSVIEQSIAALPDYAVFPNYVHPFPKLPQAVGSTTTPADAALITGALTVQAAGNTGVGQTVAILDTGVQRAHTYFNTSAGVSRVLSTQACFVTSPGTADFPCPNGLSSDTTTPYAGDTSFGTTANVTANYYHGTHVAGIAAGNVNTTPTPPATVKQGMAPGANITSVRVFGHTAGAYDSDILAGLSWVQSNAAALNIASANLSLGGNPVATCSAATVGNYALYQTAFTNLINAGVAPVVAAGNNGNQTAISPPACITPAIAIASTNFDDNVSSFSNVSTGVALAAPGNVIAGSVPNNAWAYLSGTSMATPVVAGAFALAKAADPTVSIATWLARMKATGTPVSATVVTNIPRLNIDKAIGATAGVQPPISLTATWTGFTSFTVNWAAPTFGTTPTGYRVTVDGVSTDVSAATRSFTGTLTDINKTITVASLDGANVSTAASVVAAPISAAVQALNQTANPFTSGTPAMGGDYCTAQTAQSYKVRYNSPVTANRTVWLITADGRATSFVEIAATAPLAAGLIAANAKEVAITSPLTWLTAGAKLVFATNGSSPVSTPLLLTGALAATQAAPLSPSAPTTVTATPSYERATLSWSADSNTNWRVLVDGVVAVTNTTATSATVTTTAGSHTFAVCAVQALAGGGEYTSLRTTSTVTVPARLTQTVTASAAAAFLSLASPTTAITASASTGFALTYTSTTPTVCSVNASGTITALAAGACSITVAQAGTIDYAPASAVVAITVKGTQTISATPPARLLVGAVAASLGATTTSGLTLTYTSTTPTICTVSAAGAATAVAPGACSITVSQAGNASFLAATDLVINVQVYRSQTLSVTTPAKITVGDAGVALNGAATSGLAVGYVSNTPALCSVNAAGVVTALAAGSCSITLTQSGDATYVAATAVTISIPIYLNQTISATPPAVWVAGGTARNINASTTSGLTLSYASSNTAICTVTSLGVVTPVSRGTCTITVSQAGNGTYNPATPLLLSFTVLATQSISSTPPARLVVGAAAVNINASATSGLGVTYSSNTPSTCSVNASGMLTGLHDGTCTIILSQSGDATYAAATDAVVMIPVYQTQTITATAPTQLVVNGPSKNLNASTNSGLALTFTSTTPTICDVDASGNASGKANGTCSITVSQAGNISYLAATPLVITLTVAQLQTITFAQPADMQLGGSTLALNASVDSGLTLTYASSNTGVCSVDTSGVVTAIAHGSCSITVSQSGTTFYLEATPVTRTFTVWASQTINVSAPATQNVSDGSLTLTASVNSELPIAFASTNTSVCTVSAAGVITFVAGGQCTVTLNQAGDASRYAATEQSVQFTIRSAQSIAAVTPATQNVLASVSLNATTDGGVALTYTSTTPSVCTVDAAGIVSAIHEGNCSVTINAPQSDTVMSASRVVSFTVIRPIPASVTGLIAVTLSGRAVFSWKAPVNAAAAAVASYRIKWRVISPKGVAGKWTTVTITARKWTSIKVPVKAKVQISVTAIGTFANSAAASLTRTM